MRMNAVIGAVALALAAGGLTACGSGDSSNASSASGDYCQELKADQTYFSSLDGNNPDLSKLDDLFQRIHTLAGDAPDDIASEWKTLDDTMTSIESALKQAGLQPSDLAAIQKGQLPAGVDLSKIQALAPKLQALSSKDVTAAASRIASNAKDTCGVDLTSN